MKDTVAPYRSQQVARSGFAQVLRSELTKFRTVRSWLVTLAVAAALVVAFAWVSAEGNHSNSCTSGPSGVATCTSQHPPVAVGPDGEPVVDTFTFVHQRLAGNGTVTARITSLTGMASGNSSGAGPGAGPPSPTPEVSVVVPWAKSGLMIKENTSQGSSYAAIMATPSHGVRMQYDFTHDTAGAPGRVTASSPRWLRLTRAGNLVTGYDSLDGTHWTKVGVATLTDLPTDVEAGLFVTSPLQHPAANTIEPTAATARFDSIQTVGGFSGSTWRGQLVSGSVGSYPTQQLDRSSWYQHIRDTFTIRGSGDIAPEVGGGLLGGSGETDSLQAGAAVGLVAVIVLATLFITSEYRRRLIATTLTATPRRGQVLAAKAMVIGSVTFVTATVATAVADVVTRRVLVHSGNYLFPVSAGAEARVILGTGLLFAFAAVLILALGTITRRSAGAVVTGIVVFVLPFVLVEHHSAHSSELAVSPHPHRGVRHPGHSAPVRPGLHRLHVERRVLPARTMGGHLRAGRLDRPRTGVSGLAAPPARCLSGVPLCGSDDA